ncbi:MAG: hypothetical protein JWM96_306 [Alphaproteobacteria bacterium]|nr:hypothetical protein [Alphaproteobacteria bacterium]
MTPLVTSLAVYPVKSAPGDLSAWIQVTAKER